MDTDGLQERIGYRFKTAGLLKQALTHRSHGQPNNERLEFLGDSVLNCAIATLLFERFREVDEGDLSRLRAYLVKQQALHKVAQRLTLGDSLVLGEGESKSGGTRRPSILADALEALIGAVYLDGGFETAKDLIGRLYEPELSDADPLTLGKDAKTLLQEELQRNRIPLPVYAVVATHGAAHIQEFEVECVISRLDITVLGTGGSRRAAEQSAAENALQAIEKLGKSKTGGPKKTRKTTKKRAAPKKPAKVRAARSSSNAPTAGGDSSPSASAKVSGGADEAHTNVSETINGSETAGSTDKSPKSDNVSDKSSEKASDKSSGNRKLSPTKSAGNPGPTQKSFDAAEPV
ncbi:MAG: ribonuclease III [Burkholderiaceae bacterium]